MVILMYLSIYLQIRSSNYVQEVCIPAFRLINKYLYINYFGNYNINTMLNFYTLARCNDVCCGDQKCNYINISFHLSRQKRE